MAAISGQARVAALFAFLMMGVSPQAFAATEPVKETPAVRVETELRAQGIGLDNGDLDTMGSDTIGTAALEARFKVYADITEDVLFFWEGRAVASAGKAGYESNDTGSLSRGDSFLEWRQSYFQFDDIGDTPAGVRIGRQKMRDPYGVWWNRNFDAANVYYDSTLFSGFIAGGENLMSYRTGGDDFGNNEEDVTRFLGSASWQYYYQNFLEGRIQVQNDHSDVNLGDIFASDDVDSETHDLVWFGVRASGETRLPTTGDNKFAYRADLMAVEGDEVVTGTAPFGPGTQIVNALTSRDVSGWAFDGAVDVPLPNASPILHFGYAFASGDENPGTAQEDNGFRQSGLNGNFSRFGALTENTDNYGTALRPELNNIHVLAAGATMPVFDASNAGIVYRYYRLDERATSLSANGVITTLNGVDRDLGQGLDLLFNVDILKEAEITVPHVQDMNLRSSIGVFHAGDAFGPSDGETAVRGLVELKIKL
ncbi:MAG: alginate export family protein [Alphaproteobacteria bacterium]